MMTQSFVSRSVPRLLVWALMSLGICATEPKAFADSVEELVARGVELRRQGKPDEALRVFEEAHQIAPSPRTLGNIGLTEASLARWVEAEDHLVGVLAAPDDSWSKKHREGLEHALVLVRQHVGDVLVTGPAGVEISIDNKRIGSLPLPRPIRVGAGSVLVMATSRDHDPFKTTLIVVAGGHSNIALALTKAVAVTQTGGPEATAPPPSQTKEPIRLIPAAAPGGSVAEPLRQPDRKGHWKAPAGAVLLATGAALLTWGIVWVAINGSAASGATHEVNDTSGKGWLLVGMGTAAAVGGGLLLYSDRNSGVNVALRVTPGTVVFSGHF